MAPSRSLDFGGDVAIVTGAGSRMPGGLMRRSPTRTLTIQLTQLQIRGETGNGRATAVLLARHGAKVALVDNNLEWVKETKQMIDDEGGTSEVIQADVTDEQACKEAVKKTISLFGALHILVNVGAYLLASLTKSLTFPEAPKNGCGNFSCDTLFIMCTCLVQY